MNTGVYKIQNIINGKCYVGSCADIKRGLKHRWWRHMYKLSKQKHPNPHLQNAWNKYGSENFGFEIIENVSPEKCIEREQFYLDTLNPEYNICRIAGNTLGYRHTKEAKLKVSIANTGNPNHYNDGKYRFHNKKTGEVIVCAKFELAIRYGLDNSSISKVCNKIENSCHGWICLGKE